MTYRQQLRNIRQLFTTVIHSKQIETVDYEITESDLIECIQITQGVVRSRLSHAHTVWKNDHKRNYSLLFNSIKTETIEAIRSYFTNEDGTPSKGATINKYNTLVIDAIFDMLKQAGPSRASTTMTLIKQTLIRDLSNISDVHEADAIAAKALLAKASKQRACDIHKSKKLTRGQRMAAIESAVINIQAA